MKSLSIAIVGAASFLYFMNTSNNATWMTLLLFTLIFLILVADNNK